jgi:6-phosphogluconolactonase (cycloisomerase 2 family)
VYTASGNDDSVARFRRDDQTGALAYKGCITGKVEAGPAGSDACKKIPDATVGGFDSGLDQLQSLSLSRDDKFLYAASGEDDAVSRFRVTP